MGKYKFLIREILSQSVEVVATSFDDAKRKATEMYEKGEITLDGRNYEGTEILDTCSECGSTLVENPETGIREICPICGKIWCE